METKRRTRRPLLLDEVIRADAEAVAGGTEGNRRRAADLLGISRSTLYRMLTRYGLAEESGRRNLPRLDSGRRSAKLENIFAAAAWRRLLPTPIRFVVGASRLQFDL